MTNLWSGGDMVMSIWCLSTRCLSTPGPWLMSASTCASMVNEYCPNRLEMLDNEFNYTLTCVSVLWSYRCAVYCMPLSLI